MSDRIFSWDELPYYLSAKDIAALLGLGLTKTYEVIHHKDCPKKKVGQRLLVPRDAFRAWFEGNDIDIP